MMAKQTFTTGQVLTAAQMTSLQQTAMSGGAASAKVASYVLVAADAGTAISMTNVGATTITVNTGLFAAGDTVTVVNLGAGVCTVTAGTATVSTSGSLVLAQNQGGILYFTSASAALFLQFATPASGDIEGVTAGTGLSGGGTSGTVTVTNSMATEIDAKGDLIGGTGADTFARLAVGANGTVLTADSGETTGLKWGTVSADLTWSLKSTTALTGASTITVSSLSSKAYMILANPTGPASSAFTMRFNGDTGANYGNIGMQIFGDNSYSNGIFSGGGSNTGLTAISIGTKSSDANAFVAGGLTIWSANTTGIKPFDCVFSCNAQGAAGATNRISQGAYAGTSAITSVSLISSGGNFTSGNIYVYGAD
jgi:hypothetical protein